MSVLYQAEELLQAEAAGNAPGGRRICFVCTGNTCRSPMAAAVTNHLAVQRGEQIEAFSRGLYARWGDPISPKSVHALEAAGIQRAQGHDYRLHTAANLEEGFGKTCDLIVCMTAEHAMEVIMRYPSLASRVVTFSRPIPDPYGGDERTYADCLAHMKGQILTMLFGEEAS